ncbi:MAG: SpoIID/LytB domain-containing protein, partial [Elusimicrobiaceae bacterium]
MSLPRTRYAFILILGFLNAGFCSASFEEAGKLYFSGDLKASLKAYKVVLKKNAPADVYLNAGFTARELGDITGASAIMETALRRYPHDLDVCRLAGSVFMSAEKFAKAEDLLKNVIADGSGVRPIDYIILARVQLRMKDYASAITSLDKAIALDALSAAAWYYKGIAFSEQGQTDKAADAFKLVLESDPQFLEARKKLADLRLKQGRIDDAWTNYQKLSYAEPENVKFRDIAAGLVKNLSKKPSEIMPPAQLAAHQYVMRPENTGGLPVVRIGIGTTGSGLPSDSGIVEFVPSSPFEIFDSSSGVKILSGPAKAKWRIAINRAKPDRAWIKDESGKVLFSFTNAVLIKQDKRNSYSTIIKSLMEGHGTAWATITDKELRGDIEVKKLDNKLAVVNIVNIEEYVYGVLSSEMPPRFPFEALKAQAVLARTYALKNAGKHKHEGYDLCDGQHCQVYKGVKSESSRGNSAVDATRGETLTYEGKPAQTVFSSNSGGFTQSGVSAGWGDVPYWKVASDYADMSAPPASPFVF